MLSKTNVDYLTNLLIPSDSIPNGVYYLMLAWTDDNSPEVIEERYIDHNDWQNRLLKSGFSKEETLEHSQNFISKAITYYKGPLTNLSDRDSDYRPRFMKFLKAANFGYFMPEVKTSQLKDYGVIISYYDRDDFRKEIARQINTLWLTCNPEHSSISSKEKAEFRKQLDQQTELKNKLVETTDSIWKNLKAIEVDYNELRTVTQGSKDPANNIYVQNVLPELDPILVKVKELVDISNSSNFPESIIDRVWTIRTDLQKVKIKRSDLPLVNYVAKEFTRIYDMYGGPCQTGMPFTKYTAGRNRFLSEALSIFRVGREERTVRKLGNKDNPVPNRVKKNLQ